METIPYMDFFIFWPTVILFPSAKNEDSRVKTDTGLAKNAI